MTTFLKHMNSLNSIGEALVRKRDEIQEFFSIQRRVRVN
jgi:hypothetical protein